MSIADFKSYCSTRELKFVYDSSIQKKSNNLICISHHVETYDELVTVLSPNIIAFKNSNGYMSFSLVKYIVYNDSNYSENDSIDVVCGIFDHEEVCTFIVEDKSE